MDRTKMSVPSEVVMHPLVLLSTVDHYQRVTGGTMANKRVAGVLLGTSKQGVVDVTNSFAVPFDEDAKSGSVFFMDHNYIEQMFGMFRKVTNSFAVPFDEDAKSGSVFFMDHNYIEQMFGMFRKVNARERIVGWYSTGPKIRANDLAVHELLRTFAEQPVYCIVDVSPSSEGGIPVSSYRAREEAEDEHSAPRMVFQHVDSKIGSQEAEEIGVEHLLRNVSDNTVSTLATEVQDKVVALQALEGRLEEIFKYVNAVAEGKLPIKHSILYQIQDLVNTLPVLKFQRSQKEMIVQTNDDMMGIYIASMVRAILAMHGLIMNRRQLRDAKIKKENDRVEKEKAAQEAKEKKEKEEKEAAEKKAKEEEKKEEGGDQGEAKPEEKKE